MSKKKKHFISEDYYDFEKDEALKLINEIINTPKLLNSYYKKDHKQIFYDREILQEMVDFDPFNFEAEEKEYRELTKFIRTKEFASLSRNDKFSHQVRLNELVLILCKKVKYELHYDKKKEQIYIRMIAK